MIGEQKDNDRYVNVSTKITKEAAGILNRVAESKGMEVYELLQLACFVLVRATSDKYNLSDEINRLLTLFHSEPGWKNAFNYCNPSAVNEIAEEIVILQQPDKKGFGAVLVEKPFMGEWTQTVNADYICRRVMEVTMPGVFKRFMFLMGKMQCESIADMLITLTDAQAILQLEEENRREMEAANNIADNGRAYHYGARTKVKQHRTPDGEAERQQRILFDDFDRDTATSEAKDWEGEQRSEDHEPDFRPFGREW